MSTKDKEWYENRITNRILGDYDKEQSKPKEEKKRIAGASVTNRILGSTSKYNSSLNTPLRRATYKPFDAFEEKTANSLGYNLGVKDIFEKTPLQQAAEYLTNVQNSNKLSENYGVRPIGSVKYTDGIKMDMHNIRNLENMGVSATDYSEYKSNLQKALEREGGLDNVESRSYSSSDYDFANDDYSKKVAEHRSDTNNDRMGGKLGESGLEKTDWPPENNRPATANGYKPQMLVNGIDNISDYSGGLFGTGAVDYSQISSDFDYDLINGNATAREVVMYEGARGTYGDTYAEKGYMLYVSDDERRVYNQIYNQLGKEKATEYINSIKSDLLARQASDENEKYITMAEEHPIAASLMSAAMAPYRMVSAAGQVTDLIRNGTADPNASYNRFTKMPSAWRGTVSQEIEDKYGKAFSFTYNAAMSALDSTVNAMFYGGPGLGKFAEEASLITMGSGAAAESFIEAKNRGLDDTHAALTALFSGFVEWATEHIGWGKHFEPDVLKDSLLTQFAKSAVSEGFEEFIGDIANAAFDFGVNQENSEAFAKYNELISNGVDHDTAWKQTLGNIIKDASISFAAGALSGGMMIGPSMLGQSVSDYRTGGDINVLNQYDPVTENLVTEGLSFNEKSQAYKNASKIVDQKGDALNPSRMQIGRQARLNTIYESQLQEAANDIANANEARNKYEELKADTNSKLRDRMKARSEARSAEKAVTKSKNLLTNQLLDEKSDMEIDERFLRQKGSRAEALNTIREKEQAETREAETKRAEAKKQIKEFSETLGESGKAAVRENISENTDIAEYAKNFTEIYNAAANGQDIDVIYNADNTLPVNVKQAAWTAGLKDAGRAFEETNLYEETNNVTAENAEIETGTETEGKISASSLSDEGRVYSVGNAGGDGSVSQIRGKLAAEAKQRIKESGDRFRSYADVRKIEKKSAASFGIKGGTNDATMQIIDAGGYNDELRSIKAFMASKGVNVHFFVGTIRLENGRRARGAHQGNDIFINVGSTDVSPTQLAKHEYFHHLEKNNSELREKLVNKIKARGENSLRELVNEYAKRYQWTNKSIEDIYSEILADTYGGIDIFDYMTDYQGATRFDSTVREGINQYEEEQKNLRGPPENIEEELSEEFQEEHGIEVVDQDMVMKASEETWRETDKDELKQALIDAGFGAKEVDKWINDVDSIAYMIAADRDRLDYTAADNQVMMKPNQEYVVTIDASTLCAKRLLYQGTLNAIQHKLKNTALLRDDVLRLRQLMNELGYQTPCAVCYVESRRKQLGKFADQFLNGDSKHAAYDGEYIPTIDQLTTTDGLEDLRQNYPDVYADFIKAMKKKGTANPKVVELRTAYRNDIRQLTPAKIKKINDIGGLRVQSFSDFETVHLIDMMQAVLDMAHMGLISQAYTKVPNFARVFGGTNMKINLSLIGGLNENGVLEFDPVEGMDINEALEIRDMYPENVGTILVGKNTESILAAMADDRVDFIIPFHRSGWGKADYEKLGLTGYQDFTLYQNERLLGNKKVDSNITVDSYWDYSKTGKENAEAYLEKCAEMGRMPKFRNFLDRKTDSQGRVHYYMKEDGSTDGYWKMLIDFKMYNASSTNLYSEGNVTGSEHKAVVPNFNMEAATKIMNEYDGSADTLPVASEVVDAFVNEYKDSHNKVSFSEEEIEERENDWEKSSENYRDRLSKWDFNTIGFSFVIGDTPIELLKAGIPDKQIRYDASKIKNETKHSGMGLNEFKLIPNILHDPVVVAESNTYPGRKVVIGSEKDAHGKTIVIAIELNPSSSKGNPITNVIKIATSQGRSKINSLLKDIVYVSNNTEKVQEWLNVNRVQFPLRSFILNFNGIIAQENTEVNEVTDFSEELPEFSEIPGQSDLERKYYDLNRKYIQARQQVAELQKQNDYLYRQTTETFKPTVTEKYTKKSAKKLLDEYSSGYDQARLADEIKDITEMILRDSDGSHFEDAKKLAFNAAHNILNESLEIINTDDAKTYSDLKTFLKSNNGLTISAQDRADLNGYADFKKRTRSYLKLTDNGTPVDTAYSQLRDSFGAAFFPENITHPADQLLRIEEIMQTLEPVYGNPFNEYNMAAAAEYLTMEIISLADDNLVEMMPPTFADKIRIREQKISEENHKKIETALKKEASKHKKAYDDIVKYYEDLNERQREKKIDSRDRERLLKVSQRMDRVKAPAVSRALIDQMIGELDTVSRHLTNTTISRLENLRDVYAAYQQSEDFIEEPWVKKEVERLSKKHVDDLTREDVSNLTTVLMNIENGLRNERKLINDSDKRDVHIMAEDTINRITNLKGVKGIKKSFEDFLIVDVLSPERLVNRITGYDENNPLNKLTKSLSDGQRKMLDFERQNYQKFDKWTGNKKFIDKEQGVGAKWETIEGINIKTGASTKVEITPAMKMSLYMHLQNSQNLMHIAHGGVTIQNKKLYLKGNLTEAYAAGTTIRLTPSQIRAITSTLTAQEKEFCKAAAEYFNGDSQKAINETSELLKGYSLAGVKNYFPINTDTNFTKAEFESLQRDGTIEGMGFLKERINGTNPIYLRDMNAVLKQSIDMSAKYVGLAIPVRNFNKLYRAGTGEMVNPSGIKGAGHFNASYTISSALQEKFGTSATNYIEKMMKDLQSGSAADNSKKAQLLRQLRSNYAGAVLTLSASVAVKQAASYPTAAAVIGFKPLLKAFGNVHKTNLDLINQYTPLLWYRMQGYSTTELGDIKNAKKSKFAPANWITGKDLPKALNWIQGMDVLTTAKLWKACEYYVSDNFKTLEKGSDAYYKEVAKWYNRVIEETQPNYTTMQRPELLRSDNTLMQSLMMFKTQPFQNFNILYDSINNFKAKKLAYKADNSAENKAAYKEAAKAMRNAAISQLISAAVFASATMLWKLFTGKDDKYRDDDDELTVMTIASGISKDIFGSYASMIPFGSDLYEYASSLIFDETYYGFDETTASMLNDMTKAMTKMVDRTKKTMDQVISGEGVSWNSMRLDLDAVCSTMSKAIGVPYDSLSNIFEGTYFNIMKGKYGKYQGKYEYLKLTADPEKKSSLYYDNLYGAYKHSKEDYEDIFADMIGTGGFEEDKVLNAMNSRKRKEEGVKKTSDLSERVMSPEVDHKYRELYGAVEESSIYSKFDSEDESKKKALDILVYNIASGNQSFDKALEKGAAKGLTETDYLLYRVALEVNNGRDGKDDRHNAADHKAAAAAIGIKGEDPWKSTGGVLKYKSDSEEDQEEEVEEP